MDETGAVKEQMKRKRQTGVGNKTRALKEQMEGGRLEEQMEGGRQTGVGDKTGALEEQMEGGRKKGVGNKTGALEGWSQSIVFVWNFFAKWYYYK